MQNEKCEFYGKECCMCDMCLLARKVMEDVKKVSKDEIEKVFKEAEDELKKLDK